ncbi:thiopeptide-type bacteriocin biosynthesis protein [Streptomyces sp. BI20]|uniref:thiopeptide-type bacteriocin biosynthesis protein n=1 Tax=Streptomyces sp. BI20 TaxID=3403460 RepID=UPI003C708C76
MHSAESPWQQFDITFTAWGSAEQVAALHLAPHLANQEQAGTVTAWFFVRKHPTWRLRILPAPHREAQAVTALEALFQALCGQGHLTGCARPIYEPETHAFGGTAALDITHRLFHHDSRHVLAHVRPPGHAGAAPQDHRRELSVLLATALMRAAGQEWAEQGDVWARLADARLADDGTRPTAVPRIEAALRRLMTVDSSAGSPMVAEGSLATAATWLTGFRAAGERLGALSRSGQMTRGLRAVLAHHILFHWNRLGVPYAVQSDLAATARHVVLGEDLTRPRLPVTETVGQGPAAR